MEILYARCAGCDVHKKTIKVCVLLRQADGQLHKELRTYGTTTQELLLLSDWLKEQGCTHVAMEGTGVYWKPVYNLLEGNFTVLVVNAQHIKAVPGRKTDVKDAEWIANLLQHGLLKASFIPSAPQRELRDLTRYRVRLTEERAREVNRIQKTLEDTNLKLGDVVSDIMGKASRMILTALANGETDPTRLADFAVGRVRANQQQLEAALTGSVDEHHRFLLREHLTQIEHFEKAIERVTAEIARRFAPPPPPPEDGIPAQKGSQIGAGLRPLPQQIPSSAPQAILSSAEAVVLLCSIPGISERAAYAILAEIARRFAPPPPPEDGIPAQKGSQIGAGLRPLPQQIPSSAPQAILSSAEAVVLLCSIPGISERAAYAILAEIGMNMRQFPSAGHLASWAGVCPGNHESAGKRLSGKTRKGNPWLRRLLIQVAHAAARQKQGYLPAQFRRIAARRGKRRAAMAVAHTILVIIYHLLTDGTSYEEHGETFFDEQEQQATEKRLIRQLERLGHQVTLQPLAQAG